MKRLSTDKFTKIPKILRALASSPQPLRFATLIRYAKLDGGYNTRNTLSRMVRLGLVSHVGAVKSYNYYITLKGIQYLETTKLSHEAKNLGVD